ncbi:MAG: hypothetical protein ACJ73N_05225 [Bryobacteraceae bacterium]
MADLASVPDLRRELLPESCLGAFERDTPVEFLVERLPNNPHTSLCDFAHQPKAIGK